MGRKQKLRQQKQARRKLEDVTSVAPPTPPTSSTQPIPRLTSSSTIPLNESNSMFPKSRFFNLSQHLDASGRTKYNRLVNGAEKHGCVHCMMLIGRTIEMNSNTNGMTNVHYAQPWFLEGSIRGSFVSSAQLVGIYNKVITHKPLALASYWVKMNNKYHKWNNCSKRQNWNDIQDYINRTCIICSKSDTQTLTLRQCIGCSTYCYCSKECQTCHWEEQKHSGECRQLQILNKYHKPYAKEIFIAATRGDSKIPALEKLRNKLGLSRSIEDYQEFRATNTHEGKPVDPLNYVVARTDGTVWIGSFPN